MYNDIVNLPTQFLKSYEAAAIAVSFSEPVTRVYLAGMGGSSLPADIVNDYLAGIIRIEIIRDYILPKNIGPGDLVFCASYSGNTEETLEAFDDALAKKATIVALSNGGLLQKRAEEGRIPFILIPSCVQPRQAVGHFFASILAVLEKAGLIPAQKEAVTELAQWLGAQRERVEQAGKDLASKIAVGTPIIYSPTELQSSARIFKIKLNENCKIPAFFNVFPEVNHNEMVGWTRLNMQAVFVYLSTGFMHQRIRRRMDVMKEILGETISVHEVQLLGATLLKALFEAIWLGDFTTYHMAVASGVDPAPVAMVEEFKKKL